MSETVNWSSMQDAPGAEQARQKLLRELATKSFDEGLSPEDVAKLMETAEEEERTWEPPRVLDPTSGWGPEDLEDRIMNPGEGIGAYASLLAEPERPKMAPAEAIPDLFAKMKPYKKFLVAIMNACREEADAATIDAAVEPEYEFCSCVYTPIALRKMLTEAGAIEYLMSEEEFQESLKAFEIPAAPEAEAAEVEPAADAEAAAENEGEGEGETGAAPMEATAPEAETATDAEAATAADPEPGTSPEADADTAEDEDIVDGTEELPATEEEESGITSIYDQPGYLVIEEDAPGTWMITEEGLAFLESIDPKRQFDDALGVHANVADVFYDILAYCAEQPRNITDIVNHFADDSRLGAETFYASYVVDRLEEIGALIWKKDWIPTQLGLDLLANRPEVL